MKKVYLVIEKELSDEYNEGEQFTTGNKNITAYEIVNGELVKAFDLECQNDDNSLELVKDYVDENALWEGQQLDYIVI